MLTHSDPDDSCVYCGDEGEGVYDGGRFVCTACRVWEEYERNENLDREKWDVAEEADA